MFSKKPMPLPLKVLLVVGIVFLLSGLIFFARGKKALFGGLDSYLVSQPSSLGLTPDKKGGVTGAMKSQINDEKDVIVEIEPVGFSTAGVDFRVVFTTHSVELDFDLVERVSLVSASGEKLKPISWDGGQGGHHLSGTLKFPPFTREVKSIKLVLADISAVKERVFEWNF